MIYVNAACYAVLVYLLWRSEKKAEIVAKLNHALMLQIDSNNKEFEELVYHNDLLKNEAKFVLDQHEEINNKYNALYDMNETLQKKFTLLEESYATQVAGFETQIQNLLTMHKDELEKEKKKARQDALKRSRSVMRGQATEHLAPYMMDETNPKDCRFMGNPVDYVVFDGLSAVTDKTAKEINQIKFVDIKTGKSNLNTAQRRIRDAINEGKVSFEIVNPDKKEQENETDKIN